MERIATLKTLDAIAGRWLARLLPMPSVPPAGATEPQSILLIRPGGIGDAVHLVPAIQA